MNQGTLEKSDWVLSLIIPCYNEEASLRTCVDRCLTLREDGVALELIIVDDCSTDASLAIARQLENEHPEVRVIAHEQNRGKGAALRTGLIQARGNYLGIQDADAEYSPKDYLKLLTPILEGRADVVYGSRYLRPETRRALYCWHTLMNKSLTFISNMFTNLDISDMETCYKLFTREVMAKIAPALKEDRFGFEPEVTAYVSQLQCRVYECSIQYAPRTYDEGKKINWKDGVHALYCILHYSAHCAPLPMQLLLYFFIGGVCAIGNILIYAILLGLGLSVPVAAWSGFIGAAALNYFLCIAILFRHKASWSSTGEILAYALTVGAMGLVDFLMTIGLIGLGSGPVWSKIWAALVGFMGNFLLRKHLVFPETWKKSRQFPG